ncbi:GGDEF domain-containing protein, partial [Paraburkholderia aspalathi]|nr:GGDEF domain-containing protein [Paraburkholderia aspalathi]
IVISPTELYTTGAFLVADGLLIRVGGQYSKWLGGILISVFLTTLGYLTYDDGSYFILANTLNFGIGTILLASCLQAGILLQGNTVERVFFVAFCLLPFHFFTRTFLTVGFVPDVGAPAELVASNFWNILSIMNALLGVFVGLALLVLVTSDTIIELSKERDTDPLTGLLNRRGIDRMMSSLSKKAGRDQLSIIVADLDNFKMVNDKFGHLAGDKILMDFANILKTTSNATVNSRVGGEEFVIVMSGNPATVWHRADAIRRRVEAHSFSDIPDGFKITCSIGISAIHAGEDIWTAFARADKGLVSAKQDGRNRVVTALVEVKT